MEVSDVSIWDEWYQRIAHDTQQSYAYSTIAGVRTPFLVVSIPAVLCALAVWLFVGEVERGGAEKQPSFAAEQVDEEPDSVEMREFQSESTCDNYDNFDACKLRRSQEGGLRSKAVQLPTNGSGAYVKLDNKDSIVSDSSAFGDKREELASTSSFHEQYLKPHVQTLRTLLRCPSVLLVIFQGAPGCIPWGVVNTYLNDYLASGVFTVVLFMCLSSFVVSFSYSSFLPI